MPVIAITRFRAGPAGAEELCARHAALAPANATADNPRPSNRRISP
jgi:hypothetical protein